VPEKEIARGLKKEAEEDSETGINQY